MNKKTAFIEHRYIIESKVIHKLINAIQQVIDNGCSSFIMGTHGEFDYLSLQCCRKFKQAHKDLNIDVVLTNITRGNHSSSLSNDINYVTYDIEELHFKKQIIISNYHFIDECDTLICYVDTSRKKSGAKRVFDYANKKGLRIINLYNADDNPLNNLDIKEATNYCDKWLKNAKNKNHIE